MRKLRKLLMLLLMLVLPMQGVAAACVPVDARMTSAQVQPISMPCHEHAADHAAVQPSGDDATTTTHDTDNTNHRCCHQVFSCAPAGMLTTPAPKITSVSRWAPTLVTLFIPDSHDRPPRG